jgi:hypothetical protein
LFVLTYSTNTAGIDSHNKLFTAGYRIVCCFFFMLNRYNEILLI